MSDAELFTIKLYYDGEMLDNPKRYIGGKFVYVDFCDPDAMSLLEITSMLVESGAEGGFYEIWYKIPGNSTERGLFELVSDDELLVMCALVTNKERPATNRFVEIYVNRPIEIPQTQPGQEEINMDNPFGGSTQQEIDFEQEIRDSEGLYKDFSDPEDSEEYELNGSDSDDESWHSDASNYDESDDDLAFDKNVDKMVYEDPEEPDKDDNVHTDDESVYAGSDEERMAANSTDEDDSSFPEFNEDVDMKSPDFQSGMLLKSGQIFRKAVRNHAIMERRPIELVPNYGRKIKYVCKKPCQWQVYASPFNKTATYQIRSLVRKHTCMPTFQQKQINSVWLAEHYEKEIRMNPEWPTTAFHKKIFNDLKCEVSKHAVYRAKTRALMKINGTHEAQYARVWDYAYEIKKVLPESTVKILCEDPEPGQKVGDL